MLNELMDRAKPFERGQEQAEAMLAMQKELLETCDQASRAWLDRVKSEVELWTELATKLSSTRSLPDALGTYQQCVTQRMQMAAEDGRRMSDEYQRFLQKFTRLLPNGWRPAGPERVLDLAEHPVHCIRAKSADDTSKVWTCRMRRLSTNCARSDQEDEACRKQT